MNGYDLFKELSELDDEFIMAPKKFVSLRTNIFICFIAANISRFVPRRHLILSIVVFILSFALLYGMAYWWLNRKGKNKLLIEELDAS